MKEGVLNRFIKKDANKNLSNIKQFTKKNEFNVCP